MNRILLAAAASLALAVPGGVASAQTMNTTESTSDSTMLTTEQRAMYDGWPADRRSAYDAWPNEAKSYYWTLTPEQTEGWWVLNDDQRMRIMGMTPDQRTTAWNSIRAQMTGQQGMASSTADSSMNSNANMSSSTMSSGNMQFVRREMAQPITQSSAAAISPEDLPICKPNQQDGCINAWEAGKRGPGVAKPLGYWPGKPASAIASAQPGSR